MINSVSQIETESRLFGSKAETENRVRENRQNRRPGHPLLNQVSLILVKNKSEKYTKNNNLLKNSMNQYVLKNFKPKNFLPFVSNIYPKISYQKKTQVKETFYLRI